MGINTWLGACLENNASDMHIASGYSPSMRVNGELHYIKDVPMQDAVAVKHLIYSILNTQQINEFEKQLELDFAYAIVNMAYFRVNVFKENNGISAVFRIIPMIIPTLEQLNFPDHLKKLLNLTNGLILVTGATGSGKSTTLAAMINDINKNQAKHIITIEDPIEFTHSSKKCLIRQRQVRRDTHDFSQAIRSALREDPDVILLGELRDLETIRLALTAAETGHLVMATLHTNSAARTINRIIDVFPASEKEVIRNMLSESLQAVICQTLVASKQGGRMAAFEIMLCTPAIRNLIRENKIAQITSVIQTGADIGMCTLDQYLNLLVRKGAIDSALC